MNLQLEHDAIMRHVRIGIESRAFIAKAETVVLCAAIRAHVNRSLGQIGRQAKARLRRG